MKQTFSLPALDRLDTPVLICNNAGIVIYKNPAAMRAIRLPRRNTSIRTHLRQAEEGELDRIGERKKPSILSLHTGDRPARALVCPYVQGKESGAVLRSSVVKEGEVCSLWIFPAVLQAYATSRTGQYIESAVVDVAPELCKLVIEADRMSGMLPGKERRVLEERSTRRISRVLISLEELPEGGWYDLNTVMNMVVPIIRRRLKLLGAHLEYIEEEIPNSKGLSVDLPRMTLQLLHLLTYCVALSNSQMASLRLHSNEDGDVMVTAAFTLTWPPFTVSHSEELHKLCLLLPGSQVDLLMLNSVCKSIGRGVRWSLTDEEEYNLRVTVDLPIMGRDCVRTNLLLDTDLLFLERDLEAIFGAVLEERLLEYGEEYDGL